MERSKPRQILHIIGAYTMSCRQGSKRGAYIGPRANIYCALGYARANAQPKARQPTRPKGHSIYTFSFFSSFSLTKARAAGFVLFCCLGYDVSGNNAPKGSGRRGGACPARCSHPGKTTKRVDCTGRIYASPTNQPRDCDCPVKFFGSLLCRKKSAKLSNLSFLSCADVL